MKKWIFALCSLALMGFTACGGDDPDPVTPDPDPVIPTPDPTPDPTDPETSTAFVRGADISWYTEMAADGKLFYNAAGTATECPALMAEIGMNAVRLRVWVNPENYGCSFCNQSDVVTKALAAKSAGLDVMIDFHYSDRWADPSTQEVPKAWAGLTYDEVKTNVAAHTTSVLTALKNAGVAPKWIQIGNETRGGMLYPHGQISYAASTSAGSWKNFVGLYNAGYEAAKAVFSTAQVMPHLNKLSDTSNDTWWLQQFKNAGAKFDMLAFSHYPQSDDTSQSASALNQQAVSNIRTFAAAYGVPVMVVEFGVKTNANATTAAQVAKEFMTSAKSIANTDVCAGVFYWEPEVWGGWKPASYTTVYDNWSAYDMGAFTSGGRPSSVLDAWAE